MDDEITVDPRESSFFKAMLLAEGLLFIIDQGAVALTRIWWCAHLQSLVCSDCHAVGVCSCFELGVTVLEHHLSQGASGYRLELGTCVHGGIGACILGDGPTEEDMAQGDKEAWKHRGGACGYQAQREKSFPMPLLDTARTRRVQDGAARKGDDRKHILNSLAGQPMDAPPLAGHEQYERINTALHFTMGLKQYIVEHGREQGSIQQLPAMPAWRDWDVSEQLVQSAKMFKVNTHVEMRSKLIQLSVDQYCTCLGRCAATATTLR